MPAGGDGKEGEKPQQAKAPASAPVPVAGRPVKTPPIYDLQEAQGAGFGSRYGWERANWFAPDGVEPVDRLSFRRHTSYFEHVGRECAPWPAKAADPPRSTTRAYCQSIVWVH